MLDAPFKSVEVGINLKWYKQEDLARNCWARFLMAFALTLARTKPAAWSPSTLHLNLISSPERTDYAGPSGRSSS